MIYRGKYEAVIGLEIHAQLNTKSKMYSSDPNQYGEMPNSLVNPISLGHPGTLPRVNARAVDFAIKLGLALNCKIRYENQFARKNYFYADLPKGYQITQDKTPICYDGFLNIRLAGGVVKKIGITRIHMEEDAGKSIHDMDPFNTLIDLNRAGVPLLEIVSEPDIRTPEEAALYISEIRKLVRYLDICDGNMEEGSLRCDANISVRIRGANSFGQRTEVKNINSIRNVQKAIEYEINRQIDVLESGGVIEQETRTFDAVKGITLSMRTKEMAHDYRYFPEPDLLPVYVTNEKIEQIATTMPALPGQLFEKYTNQYQLPEYDTFIITENKAFALYFDRICQLTNHYKAAANWMIGPVKSYLNENALEPEDFPLSPETMAGLIDMVEKNVVSFSVAAQKIFPELLKNPSASPVQLARDLNLIQESDSGQIMEWARQALEKYPEKIKEYQAGKKGLLGLFMGEVMKLSGGKADPKIANKILQELLNK